MCPRTEIGIWVLIFSIIITIALVAFQRFVVRRSGSLAISADSIHYKGDALVNLAFIASLVSSRWFDASFIDPLLGTAIAAYILYNAWQIVSGALDMLMDRELPHEERQALKSFIKALVRMSWSLTHRAD